MATRAELVAEAESNFGVNNFALAQTISPNDAQQALGITVYRYAVYEANNNTVIERGRNMLVWNEGQPEELALWLNSQPNPAPTPQETFNQNAVNWLNNFQNTNSQVRHYQIMSLNEATKSGIVHVNWVSPTVKELREYGLQLVSGDVEATLFRTIWTEVI